MNLTDSNFSKHFFLDQHGCAKNQVDGELIISLLEKRGLVQTFDAADADFIIINSCGFIKSAKKESLDAVISARASYPDAKIILAGCLAERYAETFKDALPEADAVFGNGDISKIDSVVSRLERNERPVEVYKQQGVCCGERKTLLGFKGSAFVKITEGCSNHCSFCAIPLIRGELRSRPAKDIVEEIENLVLRGIVEINLIGQDLAAYGTGKDDDVFSDCKDFSLCGGTDGKTASPNLRQNQNEVAGNNKDGGKKRSALSLLLEEISRLDSDFRLRLLYIHPDHFNEDILPVMQKDKRILPYFDIPFQSGDDSVIRAMNRKGDAEKYKSLVKKIRTALPGAVLRTTFLTGFPGETEANAENSARFLEAIQSEWSGCFSYSREEDTPAYSYKNRVPLKTAEARARKLSEIQHKITREKLLSYVGEELEVLVEETLEGDQGLAIGRAWFQAPDVDGNVVVRYDRDDEKANFSVQPGKLVRVKVTSSSDVDLDSVLLG